MNKVTKTLQYLAQEFRTLEAAEMELLIGGGKVVINSNRIKQGKTSTLSKFDAYAYDDDGLMIGYMSGYFLEPGYDPANSGVAGSDTAIAAGTYEMSPANFHGKSGYFSIGGVSGRDGILVHPGNTGEDTTGCFLPGSTYNHNTKLDEYSVNKSTNKMDEFRDFVNNYGEGRATINIKDSFTKEEEGKN